MNEEAVVGIDIEIPTIQDIIRNHNVTPSTSIALTDQQGQLLAWKNGRYGSYKPQISVRKDGSKGMPLLADQDAPVLNQIRKTDGPVTAEQAHTKSAAIDVHGETWSTYQTRLHIPGGQDLNILIASPHAELLADILSCANKTS